MNYSHSQVKGMMDFIREAYASSPWKNPVRFLKSLHRITPFDNSAAFMKIDPATSKILPSSATLWGDEPDVMMAHNAYFWQFKQPVVQKIINKEFCSFHVQNRLPQILPKKKSEEYQVDFWEKYKKRYSYAQYFKTREGWFSLYLTRTSRSPDFSEEEQSMLDLLVPHMKMILSSAEPDGPTLFADANGKIVCIGSEIEKDLKKHPGLEKRLRADLPTWIHWFLSEPFKPLRVEITENGVPYCCWVAPIGTGRRPLFRITWEALDQPALLPDKVLSDFSKRYGLSPREKEIVLLAVAGKQRKEMAHTLGLSIDTVKEYLASTYQKTSVEGKAALVAKVLSGLSLSKTEQANQSLIL